MNNKMNKATITEHLFSPSLLFGADCHRILLPVPRGKNIHSQLDDNTDVLSLAFIVSVTN